MSYTEEIVIAGKTIETTKKVPTRRKKVPRSPNRNPTPEEMRKVNERNAETKLRRLINTNFGYKDIHLVLTYRRDRRPQSAEEAKKDLGNFLRKLRENFRRRNQELKYVAVTEYGRQAIHHHLVINSMDTRDLADIWPHGQPRPTYLDNSGQYGNLAAYLIKETSKTFGTENGVHGKRWCASQNLQQPKIIRRTISAKSWKKEPVAKKGYYIEKESVRAGISARTGFPYQFYRQVKIPDWKEARKT